LNVIIGYTDSVNRRAFGDWNHDHPDTPSRVREQAIQLLDLIQATPIRVGSSAGWSRSS
jgi:hypothetical protein